MKKLIALLMAMLMLLGMTLTTYASNFYYNHSFFAPIIDHKQYNYNRTPKSTVVTLMYHKISEDPAEIGAFCVSPETFEEDIIWLKDNGYSFCFSSEVDNVLNGELPYGKYVAITFDDGYESDYKYAMPILEKHSAKATFFIIGSTLGQADNITVEQLKLLSQSECVQIGNHSYELHSLPVEEIRNIFAVDDINYIVKDFKYNAKFLKKIIGKDALTISFPNGIWSGFAVSELMASGFTEFYTSDIKPVTKPGIPHGRVNRYSDFPLDVILQPQLDS